MSTAGVGGDALTAAGRIRSHDPGTISNALADREHLLAIPKRRTRTEEERARDAALEAVDRHKASKRVAKYSMLLRHGCQAQDCQSAFHAADRDAYGGRKDGGEGMAALLQMLGLRPTPEVEARARGLGYRKRQYELKGMKP